MRIARWILCTILFIIGITSLSCIVQANESSVTIKGRLQSPQEDTSNSSYPSMSTDSSIVVTETSEMVLPANYSLNRRLSQLGEFPANYIILGLGFLILSSIFILFFFRKKQNKD